LRSQSGFFPWEPVENLSDVPWCQGVEESSLHWLLGEVCLYSLNQNFQEISLGLFEKQLLLH
jgi:hypothetical protein